LTSLNVFWGIFFGGGAGFQDLTIFVNLSWVRVSASCGTDGTETIGFFSVNLLKQIYILVFNLKLFISNQGWQPF